MIDASHSVLLADFSCTKLLAASIGHSRRQCGQRRTIETQGILLLAPAIRHRAAWDAEVSPARDRPEAFLEDAAFLSIDSLATEVPHPEYFQQYEHESVLLRC
ncbi:unnamed protein product [Durusdinium trenchii]|uniref:Uncharacterized protein n=1 Tax=Durusdinium trenchii TaxID=1381693 RepID=A0ABP0IZX7_9DINO